MFVPEPVWNAINGHGVSCLLIRFIPLQRPKKETLFDYIKRSHGRSAIKDVFGLTDNDKKAANK